MARATTNSAADSNTNGPKEIQLYALYEIARKINSHSSQLQSWIENDEVATPPAAFRQGSQFYWTDESIPAWKALQDNEIQRLLNMKWTKEQLVDLLIEKCKATERIAARAYHRGRGEYSMSGARMKVVELQGIIDFVSRLGQSGLGTEEQRSEIYRLLGTAKSSLEMQ